MFNTRSFKIHQSTTLFGLKVISFQQKKEKGSKDFFVIKQICQSLQQKFTYRKSRLNDVKSLTKKNIQ